MGSPAFRDENGRKWAGKTPQSFPFPFLLRKTGAGAEQPGTEAKTGYNGYGNGREPKNLRNTL